MNTNKNEPFRIAEWLGQLGWHLRRALRIQRVASGIEAGVGVAGFLDEKHLVLELPKPDQVLEDPRHHAPERVANHIRTNDDTCHVSTLRHGRLNE